MTRVECEKKIARKMKEIVEIYKEYNPNGDALNMAAHCDGRISFFNRYWVDGEDYDKPIDYSSILDGDIDK